MMLPGVTPNLENWVTMLDKADLRTWSSSQKINYCIAKEIDASKARRTDALKKLSQPETLQPGGKFDSFPWTDAADWLLEDTQECFCADSILLEYLLPFNLVAANGKTWRSRNMTVTDTVLQLALEVHFEGGGYTWYSLEVCLCISDTTYRWRAPRRLCQLRGLHDFVRLEMGAEYSEHFEATPFARHTGPSGTTARLRSWLCTCSKLFNERKVSPRIAVSMLTFLFAEDILPKGAPLSKDNNGLADDCLSEKREPDKKNNVMEI